MVNAQQWLDKWYPLNGTCMRKTEDERWKGSKERGWNNFGKTRNEITKLDIGFRNLEGNLNFEGFTNLEKLCCNDNQLTNLDLTNLTNLEELICNQNKLTNLNLSNLTQLTLLRCRNNYLTNLNFLESIPNPEKLIDLVVRNNNIIEGNLTEFSKFVNLQDLWIGNNGKDKYNHFTGSLEPLTNLEKLKSLNIENTDIILDLENLNNLPKELEKFYWQDDRNNPQTTELKNVLEVCRVKDNGEDNYYDFQFWKWKNMHSDFTPEIKEQWEINNFNYEECKKWIEVGFNPDEYEFINWLKNVKKWESKDYSDNYSNIKENKSGKHHEVNESHLNNDFYSWRKNWREKISILNASIITQIKDFNHKQLTDEQEELLEELIPNKELRERYKKFGLCKNCHQPYVSKQESLSFLSNSSERIDPLINWCQFCRSQEFKRNFFKWTSGNKEIDEFIQKQQLRATTNIREILLWIPYEQFSNIEEVGEGGFGKVYKAKRKINNSLGSWNSWVALKVLNSSQNITIIFLQEVANHKLLANSNNVVYCYGISQDPKTKDYIIVMDYKGSGNLRDYLKKDYDELDPLYKLAYLIKIAEGLKEIHEKGLIHRDLHLGNILLGEEKSLLNKIEEGLKKVSSAFQFSFSSSHKKGIDLIKQSKNIPHLTCISDLGLCRPASEKDKSKVFGILPYVAPEVLQGQPYTQASDVYSFGIVTYELLAKVYPYAELKLDDINLALSICKGLRPNLEKLKIPQLLKNLIKKCWVADASKRPKFSELEEVLNTWWNEIVDRRDSEFCQQYQEVEKEHDHSSKTTPYRIHPNATLTSKPINTKKISKLLEDSKQNDVYKTTEFDMSKLHEVLEEINEQENDNWTNIHLGFTPQLIHSWKSHNFTPQQTQEWVNIGLQPTDYNFAAWLRGIKYLAPEQVLNHENLEQLNQEFFNWWQEQQQSNIEQPPK